MYTVVIVIVIFIIIYMLYNYIYQKPRVNRFTHTLPKKRFDDVVREFGTPTYVYNAPDGVAIWDSPDFFEKVMLVDESVEHKSPKPHCDFLYSTVKVHIPVERLQNVLGLSQSIYYDRLKGHLTSRCHFMGANVATLLLALRIANDVDDMNIAGYYGSYGPTIMSTMDETVYKKLYGELKQLVVENQTKYKSTFPNKKCFIEA